MSRHRLTFFTKKSESISFPEYFESMDLIYILRIDRLMIWACVFAQSIVV